MSPTQTGSWPCCTSSAGHSLLFEFLHPFSSRSASDPNLGRSPQCLLLATGSLVLLDHYRTLKLPFIAEQTQEVMCDFCRSPDCMRYLEAPASVAGLKQSGVEVKSIQRTTWRLHNHKQPFHPYKCQVRIGIPQVPELFSFLQRVFEFPRSGEKSRFSSGKAPEICGISTTPEGHPASFPRHSSLSETPVRPGPRRRETLPLSNIQPAKWVSIIAHSTESRPAF